MFVNTSLTVRTFPEPTVPTIFNGIQEIFTYLKNKIIIINYIYTYEYIMSFIVRML